MNEFQIIIVGSGPAGIAAALHLLKLAPGLAGQTLVLEKARHPRPKLCGGGLTVDAEVLLQKLGLDISKIPSVEVATAHLDFKGNGLRFKQRRGRTLRIIRRDEFDAWLVSEARQRGLQIREGVKVNSLQAGNEYMTLETDAGSYQARVVIGADGSTGTLRRYVKGNCPSNTGRALEILVQGDQPCNHLPEEAYFEFSPIPRGIAGYMWDFPTRIKGKPAHVWGIYDSNLYPSNKRPPLRELLGAELSHHGLRLDDYTLQGHPIHIYTPCNIIATHNLVLVGDAAGADPFFGEGISMALASGIFAARQIHRAFITRNFAFSDYSRRFQLSPLGRILFFRWFIASILFGIPWNWFQFLVWRILKPLVNFLSRFLVLNWAYWIKTGN